MAIVTFFGSPFQDPLHLLWSYLFGYTSGGVLYLAIVHAESWAEEWLKPTRFPFLDINMDDGWMNTMTGFPLS
jgi:hypothetical protein